MNDLDQKAAKAGATDPYEFAKPFKRPPGELRPGYRAEGSKVAGLGFGKARRQSEGDYRELPAQSSRRRAIRKTVAADSLGTSPIADRTYRAACAAHG